MANDRFNNRNQTANQYRQQQTARPYEPLQKDSYVERAEKVIQKLAGNLPTTTQIRNILSMLNQIYNDVLVSTEATLSEEVQSQLRYLKVKLIYAAGRDQKVKAFITESQIEQHLDKIGSSREAFILYSRYMEALVAYHKFYGGRD